jgi:hypothetical protein
MKYERTDEELVLDILRDYSYNDNHYFRIIASNAFIVIGNTLHNYMLEDIQDIAAVTYYGMTSTNLYETAPNPYPESLLVIMEKPVFSEGTIIEINREADVVKDIYLDIVNEAK